MKALNLSTGQSFATTDLGKGMGMFEILKAKDRAEFEKKKKKKKKKERKYKGGEKTEKMKKEEEDLFPEKITHMNLAQTVHSQTFQTPLQLPENIGSFLRKINARHYYLVSINIKFKLTRVYSASQSTYIKYNAKSDLQNKLTVQKPMVIRRTSCCCISKFCVLLHRLLMCLI